MKSLAIIGVFGLFLFWAGEISWAGDRFEYRQQRQLRKIHDGLRTGRITDREFKRLSKEQARIKKFRKRAKEKGYNFKTRNFLETMQKRAAVSIYSATNNGRTIFNRGRVSGAPAYGTTRLYNRNCRPVRSSSPRAVNLPGPRTGGRRGAYRGSRSGVRAAVRW